ncbi:MAG: HNH endonuclease [Alteromonadaceae bacterium]|nr:HNH endonuclease [Alteromonadaceae bacterium]
MGNSIVGKLQQAESDKLVAKQKAEQAEIERLGAFVNWDEAFAVASGDYMEFNGELVPTSSLSANNNLVQSGSTWDGFSDKFYEYGSEQGRSLAGRAYQEDRSFWGNVKGTYSLAYDMYSDAIGGVSSFGQHFDVPGLFSGETQAAWGQTFDAAAGFYDKLTTSYDYYQSDNDYALGALWGDTGYDLFAGLASGGPLGLRSAFAPKANSINNFGDFKLDTNKIDFDILPPDSPGAYSVAFEMKLDLGEFGRSRSVHFNRANAAFDNALQNDFELMNMMDDLIPGVQSSVSSVGGRATPTNWTWEHASTSTAAGNPGVMRLVPSSQHTPGSSFWRVLHPDAGASGGYSEWAIPNGAPKN